MPACLVTGAARGLGLAIARSLISDGWQVVGLSRDAGALAAAAARFPAGAFLPQVGDVRRYPDLEAAAAAARQRFGGLSAVVANSGVAGPTGPLEETSPEAWQDVLETNLIGAFLTCRATIPELRRNGSGRIVLIGSTTGKNGVAHRSAYGASKTGLIGLTRCLAAELGGSGITVNLVCPGTVSGERWNRVAAAIAERRRQPAAEVSTAYARAAALRRLVEPDEVGGTVAWLLGPAGGAVTGQDLNVCCGLTPS